VACVGGGWKVVGREGTKDSTNGPFMVAGRLGATWLVRQIDHVVKIRMVVAFDETRRLGAGVSLIRFFVDS